MRDFTFILTEDCNYSCSYCYQKKGKKYLDSPTIEKAVNFFLPRLTEECYINFHGGEPLLAFDKLEHTLDYIEDKNNDLNKNIHYAIVTNGSLLNDDILQVFKQKNFSLLLSFDGILQDIARKKNSFQTIVGVIEKVQKIPGIELKVCHVFTPETVSSLSESLRFIMELGVADIYLTLSTLDSWNPNSLLRLEEELTLISSYLLSYFRQSGNIPLLAFRKEKGRGIFFCSAGQDRMALDPNGNLWGCYLFPDYFKEKRKTKEYHNYCFGDLDSFIEDNDKTNLKTRENYSSFAMNNFYTSDTACRDCSELFECVVCPMDAALSGFTIGEIPDWTCKIKKLLRKKRRAFWKEFKD